MICGIVHPGIKVAGADYYIPKTEMHMQCDILHNYAYAKSCVNSCANVNSVLLISHRYWHQYLHIADLSLSTILATVGIYGCIADISRRVVHMVVVAL